MTSTETISFNIIAAVGTARSNYVLAIDAASEGKFDEAAQMIQEGNEAYEEGHQAHAQLLTKFAQGANTNVDLLLAHAEDQMSSAEAFGILAERFVTLYKKIYSK